MVNDPISDSLAQIKNGYLAHKEKLVIPYSKVVENIAQTLVKNNFLKSVKTDSQKESKQKRIIITLLYNNGMSAITNIIRVSKPGMRVYAKANRIPKVYGGLGMTLLTTPKGILTGSQARRQKSGGEIICKLW